MARTHINFRTWAALIVLGLLTIVFASLGNWQLNRATQRDAIREQITAAATQPRLALDAETPSAQLVPWRPAQAEGRWLHRYTVLLQNRNHEGRPGFWVATPLQLSDHQATALNMAVLVLRGWLPREDVIRSSGGQPEMVAGLADKLASQGVDHQQDVRNPVQVSGELLAHVPRVLELWSLSDRGSSHLADQLDARSNQRKAMPDQLPVVQNLDLTEYASAISVNLLPAVLAQTDAQTTMVQDWPRPSTDADTNRGYALQWFSFCAIAAGALLVIAWRALRPTRGQS